MYGMSGWSFARIFYLRVVARRSNVFILEAIEAMRLPATPQDPVSYYFRAVAVVRLCLGSSVTCQLRFSTRRREPSRRLVHAAWLACRRLGFYM